VYSLDARLAGDTHHLGDLPLCQVLLCNDAQYPWFILVPRQEGASEIFDLEPPAQDQLWQETRWLSQCLAKAYHADKMNVATLGNAHACHCPLLDRRGLACASLGQASCPAL
jgi:diadenosine tetraphosphate (Ap4A) HIT family hydrolase